MIWSDQLFNDSGQQVGAFLDDDPNRLFVYIDGEEDGMGQIVLSKHGVRRLRNLLAAAERRMP